MQRGSNENELKKWKWELGKSPSKVKNKKIMKLTQEI
jgi:hypothetical protein